MNQEALFTLLSAARTLCGHTEYVIIGSLSVLGIADVSAIPADMTLSIDADCYTLADPARVFDLKVALGEGSAFHKQHGIYLNPISPRLPTLPTGWERRLIPVAHSGIVAHFLEPHDAAVSKIARGERRDVRWIVAGVRGHILALPLLFQRMKATSFLDQEEQDAAFVRLRSIQKRLAARRGTAAGPNLSNV